MPTLSSHGDLAGEDQRAHTRSPESCTRPPRAALAGSSLLPLSRPADARCQLLCCPAGPCMPGTRGAQVAAMPCSSGTQHAPGQSGGMEHQPWTGFGRDGERAVGPPAAATPQFWELRILPLGTLCHMKVFDIPQGSPPTVCSSWALSRPSTPLRRGIRGVQSPLRLQALLPAGPSMPPWTWPGKPLVRAVLSLENEETCQALSDFFTGEVRYSNASSEGVQTWP